MKDLVKTVHNGVCFVYSVLHSLSQTHALTFLPFRRVEHAFFSQTLLVTLPNLFKARTDILWLCDNFSRDFSGIFFYRLKWVLFIDTCVCGCFNTVVRNYCLQTLQKFRDFWPVSKNFALWHILFFVVYLLLMYYYLDFSVRSFFSSFTRFQFGRFFVCYCHMLTSVRQLFILSPDQHLYQRLQFME